MSASTDPVAGTPVVVMGVSGSGKTTVGSALAAAWGRAFIDADDLHPAGNKAKMAAGIPLDDVDRAPWLAAVSTRLKPAAGGGVPVVACSALKHTYRDALRASAPDTIFVHLDPDADTLHDRMRSRDHEYMPVSLLASQLATLEPLSPSETGIAVDGTASVDSLVDTITAALS